VEQDINGEQATGKPAYEELISLLEKVSAEGLDNDTEEDCCHFVEHLHLEQHFVSKRPRVQVEDEVEHGHSGEERNLNLRRLDGVAAVSKYESLERKYDRVQASDRSFKVQLSVEF